MNNSKLTSELAILKYQGCIITWSQDSKLVNLNQLWKAAGSPKRRDPKRWLDLDSSELFISALERKLNAKLGDILRVAYGRGGETWGHWQIAMAYAKYLDPDLHIQVNEWAKLYWEEQVDPEKGVDRAIQNWKRQGKSDSWIDTRLRTKQTRHKFTHTLKQHGVKGGIDYARCTNAINEPVLGGKAGEIKKSLGLSPNVLLRDNLSTVQIAALGLAEALAEEDIETNSLYGFSQCHQSCKKAGNQVKRALA